ncbi:MAG: DsbA family protein [Minwuia sp.]|uniref:DsbA family protein n=1 Tax=Minwuia sp. TaxID=2493630 RepID=UPI003A8C3AE0
MQLIFRLLLTAVLAAGLARGVLADDTAAAKGLTPAEVEKIVHEYLMKHPEVIVESLQRFQERQDMAEAERAKAMLAAHRDRLDDPTGRFTAGNPDGDVTIVEFFDYRCGYCKRVMPSLFDEVAKDGGVKLVFKEFPVLGEDSVRAARAAIAAARQDRYYDMHLALMQTRGDLSEQKIMSIAGDLGLDTAKLKDDMRAPEVEEELARNYELAQILNIRGTPGFVIGDELVPGAISAQQFRDLIQRARDARG